MRIGAAGLVLVGGALCAPLTAQQLPIYRLGEIVVSARLPVTEAAATLRVVTAEDIAAAGARTLDEALILLPGFDVRTGAAGVPRVNIRGFRSRHVLILLDGIPLNSTFDGQTDPSFIPVENIAVIKFTPGTGSVLYGQGGLAGVINVVTRAGAGALEGQLGAELRQGSARTLRASAGGATSRVGLFASGSLVDADGYPSVSVPPSAGGGDPVRRQNSDRERRSVFASATADAGKGLRLGVTLSRTEGAYGIPPGLIDDAGDPFANRPAFERMEDRQGTSAQLAAGFDPPGPLSIRSWAFVNRLEERQNRYDDSSYSSMDDSLVRGTYAQLGQTKVVGVGLQTTLASSRLGHVSLGLSAERDAWDLDLTIRDVPVSGGGGGGGGGGGSGQASSYDLRTIQADRHLQRFGVALEYELSLWDRSGLVLGYAHHWLAAESRSTRGADAFGGGAYVDLPDGTRLRVAAARRFRFPTIRQLYDEDGGNTALNPERAATYEIGAERRLPGRSRVVLALFRTDVRDYIERPEQNVPFSNYDAYLFQGLEATAETRALPALLVRVGYTLLQTEDRSPGAERTELQYRPRHRASLEGRYAVRGGLTAAVSVLHVGGQVYYSRREPVAQAALPAYTLVGLRLAQQLLHGRAEAYVGADNVLNVAYEEEYGSPQATRTVYGGLAARW
jgi:outer membrane cobalamin receptor